MRFINKGRAEGKSFIAVQIAALSTGGVTVIASDISHKRYLQQLATEHFDKKINVLTYDDLINGKLLGQKERNIIIDNTEMILGQIFRGYNIVAVTGDFGNQDVFSNPPQTEQKGFTTDDMQKLVTKIKLDKQESGITDQQIIDKQTGYDDYQRRKQTLMDNVVLRQQLELANKTIEALTKLILNPKQQ